MLVLVTESLAGCQAARMKVLAHLGKRHIGNLTLLFTPRAKGCGDLAVVGQKLLKVLGAENIDLGQEKLPLDERSVSVVQNSPNGNKILQLSPGLFHDTILTGEHDGHARQVLHLSAAHDERVDVKTASGKDARHAGQDTRLVLDEAVEDVPCRRSHGWGWRLVENVGDGGLRGPGRRRIAHGEGGLATSESLVGDSRRRAAVGAVPQSSRRIQARCVEAAGRTKAGGRHSPPRRRQEEAAGGHDANGCSSDWTKIWSKPYRQRALSTEKLTRYDGDHGDLEQGVGRGAFPVVVSQKPN